MFSFIIYQSGGNKRKVSCAVAFIGKPSVVILDEVSINLHLDIFILITNLTHLNLYNYSRLLEWIQVYIFFLLILSK